jgi:photosystem II stability/assembly factor-like uncharacterized protein
VARSSRSHFFIAILALIGVLGALSYAQNATQKPAAKPAEKPTAAAPAQAQAPAPPAAPAVAPLPMTADDFNQFSWRWIGPMTFSGRMVGYAVPQGQSQIYYALTASGGIWKTVDGGTHFEPIFEKYGTQSMGWMAIAPSNANILYLGTGESMHARASTHGNGMWKSTDAGKTWTNIGLTKSYFIPKVAVDSKNPDIVYVAAEGKLYDNEPDCERGLFKSTDGGKTWVNTTASIFKDRGVGDFVIDPTNSDVVIASLYRHYRRAWTYDDRAAGNGIFKTTDGGKTWKRLASELPAATVPLGKIGLDIFAKNPKIVYARVDEEVNLGFPERDGVANFTVPAAPGAGGFGGGGGRGGAANYRPDSSFTTLKTFKLDPLFVKAAGLKFTPIAAEKEADFVTKLNEHIADKDFLTKNAIDLAKFVPAARKTYAKDSGTIAALDELDKLTKKPAPAAADSTEAKVRSQVTNRLVLETIYSPILGNIAPTRRNGVVYRSDDQGETWKRMTVYAQLAGGGGRGGVDADQGEFTMGPSEDDSFRGGLFWDEQQAAQNPPAAAQVPAGQGRSATTPAAQPNSAQVNQTEGGYYGRIIIDPNDDKVLYCGDTNTTVSKDSGRIFGPTGWDGNGRTHVDHRSVWVDPMSSKHILSANDGGTSETWDGGLHWSQKSTINVQQFYDVSVDNELPYNIMGGTQDNGAWIGPSQNRNSYGLFANDWRYLPTGDGFYVVRDWWNPEYIYYESQFGSSSRQNLNTGETSQLAPRLTPEQITAGEPALRYQWNAPIVLSPHNPGIVYVASQYVWRSLNRGATGSFQRISPDLSKASKEKLAEARKTNLQWATVYSFSESPKKPGLYWAGTDDGNVQVSTDAGANWTNITDQFYDKTGKPKVGPKGETIIKGDLIPYDRWVKRVVASAFDENTAYLAYSGYRSHNEDKTWLFVTKDLGKTWTNISGGMNNPIFDVEEDPDNANVLYLGTDYGVFVTVDQGKTWAAFSTTAPHVTIRDIAIQKRDREMAIGTYGRGFYVADIGPIKDFKADAFQGAAFLFDPKPTVKWNRYERRGDTLGEMAKADNPAVGATIYYYLKADVQSARFTVKDLEGTTIQEFSGSAKKGLQKVFWNLNRGAAAGGRGPSTGSGQGGRGGAGGGGADAAAGAGAPAVVVNNPDQPPVAPAGGGGRGRGGVQVDAGVYKVTLMVDGKEVATKKMTVQPDPLFK